MRSPNCETEEKSLLYHITPEKQDNLKSFTDLAEYISKVSSSLLLTDTGCGCLTPEGGVKISTSFSFPESRFPAVEKNSIFEIPDTNHDTRFSTHPLLRLSSPRYFAALALVNLDNKLLGYLTIQDQQPNSMDEGQKATLLTLAEQLLNYLETNSKSIKLQNEIKKQQEDINHHVKAIKHAEGDLRKLTRATSHSSNAIVFLDLDGTISWVNQSFERMFGYLSSEVVGKFNYDFLSGPDTKTKDFEKAINKIQSAQGGDFELLLYHKDGTPVWILASLNPIIGENGNTEAITSIITDISALKKADLEIQKLSLIATESPGGVLVRDPKGITLWVNKAFELTSGYIADELIGKDISRLFNGPHTDLKVHKKAAQRRAKGQESNIELLLYRKDTSACWIQLITYPLLNKEGKIESMVTLIQDITERRKRDEEFQMLSLVASKTITGVAINDREGKVFWCNTSFEKMSGYTLPELKGQLLGTVMKGPNTDLKELKAVRGIAKKKRSFYTEMLSYTKDGSPFWLAVSSTPVMDESGRLVNQVDIVDDITARKEAELQLIKTKDEALQLSKAKEMFLSVMSHEIRTPLNTVNGITQLLLDDKPTKSQIEYLKLLKFSGQNLSTLINDILDLTKMETGNLTLEKSPLNLHELLSNTINSLQVKAAQSSTTLLLNIGERVPAKIQGDSLRLYQILMNLTGNAIKFTGNGKVKLSVKLINETNTSIKLGFKITDTGIGIAADKLETIFEAYTQAASDTARKFGGTGLGLTITKSLLKLHGSNIKARSKVGKGSSFAFNIEFDKADKERAPAITENRPLSTLPILVVDDNEINRKIAKRVLTGSYPEIHFAENGEIALEKVQQTRYHCVLMDVHMPVMDGIAATTNIRSLNAPYYKDLPIIALTGSTAASDLINIRTCGMNGHILKPVNKEDLLSMLRELAIH